MIIKIYAAGIYCDGEPLLRLADGEDPFIPEHWQLIHTQEVHLNISKEEVLKNCMIAKGMEYEIEARLDHKTGGDHE